MRGFILGSSNESLTRYKHTHVNTQAVNIHYIYIKYIYYIHMFICMYYREITDIQQYIHEKKTVNLFPVYNMTPVLLPGKSHGRRGLVGCCLWGRTESDATEAT